MNIRKIAPKTIIILLIGLLVSGCGKINKGQKRIASYKLPDYQAEIIIEGIKTKNASIIAEQFCPYVKENYPDLEEQIDEWMEFIDGEIISYDNPQKSPFLGEYCYGTVKYRCYEVSIENVKTSTGKTYSIGHGVDTENIYHPEFIGITEMCIFDEDQYDENADPVYPDTAVCRLEFPETYKWMFPDR